MSVGDLNVDAGHGVNRILSSLPSDRLEALELDHRGFCSKDSVPQGMVFAISLCLIALSSHEVDFITGASLIPDLQHLTSLSRLEINFVFLCDMGYGDQLMVLNSIIGSWKPATPFRFLAFPTCWASCSTYGEDNISRESMIEGLQKLGNITEEHCTGETANISLLCLHTQSD